MVLQLIQDLDLRWTMKLNLKAYAKMSNSLTLYVLVWIKKYKFENISWKTYESFMELEDIF